MPETGGDGSFYVNSRLRPAHFTDGCLNVAVMDGSVHFVREEISPLVWRAGGTRAGGEPVAGPSEAE